MGSSREQLPLGIIGTGPVVGPPAFINVPSFGGRAGSGVGVLGAGEGVLGAGEVVLGAGGDGVFGAGGGGVCVFGAGEGLGGLGAGDLTSPLVPPPPPPLSRERLSHAVPSLSLSRLLVSEGSDSSAS